METNRPSMDCCVSSRVNTTLRFTKMSTSRRSKHPNRLTVCVSVLTLNSSPARACPWTITGIEAATLAERRLSMDRTSCVVMLRSDPAPHPLALQLQAVRRTPHSILTKVTKNTSTRPYNKQGNHRGCPYSLVSYNLSGIAEFSGTSFYLMQQQAIRTSLHVK